MKSYSRVCAEINLDAIAYNMEQLKNRIGKEGRLVAVLKTDGYGHGAVPIAEMFEETEYVWGYATASLEEAVLLKKAGMKKPVLVLGCIFPEQYEEMIQYEIRTAVYTEESAVLMAETAKQMGKTAYFHIKIDTGMGRIGFPVCTESVDCLRRISKFEHVCMEGMFTHFAKADETDKTYTLEQHEKFQWMKKKMEENHIHIRYYDCDNSAGIIDLPAMRHDLARAGIAMYGLYPSQEVKKDAVKLKPALALTSHIIYVKEIEAGTSISYGGTFISPKKMKVATIPVGYGDGYPRSLSNKGEVLIRGKRAKILGRICMDQLMADVTDIEGAGFMDPVVLVGKDGTEEITVEELSELSGRFPYEFICCLGKRIPRNYWADGKVVRQIDSF
ncbi:alanine racemase [Faecalicatena acetigenes]|uniref:Alanine racemase n=1 Tax=Faecalicatena acetigenes TaxID=2981790 RepID=A0ABT2T8Z0_9FIRM|nr:MULTISPECIES: alanine racemase [Lachnospiraceae]MCU6746740.1 alanine racemase [Faecalicatena acetigenes]SCH38965.1 Alanine racemase [uncultured Clostridium sp.]